jgi:hypothetical protein
VCFHQRRLLDFCCCYSYLSNNAGPMATPRASVLRGDDTNDMPTEPRALSVRLLRELDAALQADRVRLLELAVLLRGLDPEGVGDGVRHVWVEAQS